MSSSFSFVSDFFLLYVIMLGYIWLPKNNEERKKY